jgi:hypothetical protein
MITAPGIEIRSYVLVQLDHCQRGQQFQMQETIHHPIDGMIGALQIKEVLVILDIMFQQKQNGYQHIPLWVAQETH